MENKPLISVLLPVYKHEAYLMDAVQSIINQTFEDWELLILNDDPHNDLSEYINLDCRIRVSNCSKNKGKWYRINEGFNLSRGMYIAFQDADDISIPQRLELSIKNIGRADLIYGDAIGLLKDGTKQYLKPWFGNIDDKPVGNQGSYFIKLTDKVPNYPEIGRGDDWIFIAKCIKAKMILSYIPLPFYYYRDYTGNFRASSNKIKRFFSNRKLRKLVNQITQQ